MLELLAMMLPECLFFLGYITGKSEFPKQLPREEEEDLITRMFDGDEEARQSLITHNLRLVSHIARKYTVPGYGADDLISIGVIGLIKAVNSYKPTSGTALGTYAARCIENEILMTLRASRDEGKTWNKGYVYDSRECWGYSCIAMVDDEHVGIIYESTHVSENSDMHGIGFLIVPLQTVMEEN